MVGRDFGPERKTNLGCEFQRRFKSIHPRRRHTHLNRVSVRREGHTASRPFTGETRDPKSGQAGPLSSPVENGRHDRNLTEQF